MKQNTEPWQKCIAKKREEKKLKNNGDDCSHKGHYQIVSSDASESREPRRLGRCERPAWLITAMPAQVQIKQLSSPHQITSS